ncbi:hypothetical protein F2Q70_00032324 [Brassica cretica]|uniref:Uncharacterized protein n=1 Tax=Brassica cretica TaxID=69181 RepID=A0A8S9FM68_BRACR|nr:hypothetical protein F2Q70_00032324 [Brassica cretica]
MVDSEDRYSTEKASSVQSTILYDCDAEALSKSVRPRQSVSLMVKRKCCPELVQFYGFRSVEVLLDTPLGSPKNCPEARGGSVRVHISLSRPVGFYMVKPRLCPSQDKSSPVQSSHPLGFGQVFSDQPAAYRQRTLLTSGSGGILHVSWTCSQPCVARVPSDGSVQLNSSRPPSSFDDQVEVMFRVSSVPRFLIDTPPGTKVMSKSRSVQFSPVKASIGFWPSPLRSTSCLSAKNTPDIWEEWWRPACVLDMQPAMWNTRCRRTCVRSHAKRHTGCHQPEADWPVIFSYNQVEVLSKIISVPLEVLLDAPPGSPKNCPEARGGSVRVQISLSRPVSFYMVKPRLCPSQDQSSPVQVPLLGSSIMAGGQLANAECLDDIAKLWIVRSVEVLLDTPPGSPKNCPGAKGDSVKISLSRPVSVFMVKPRLCPRKDQSIHSSHVVNWVLAKSSPINQLLIGKEHCEL